MRKNWHRIVLISKAEMHGNQGALCSNPNATWPSSHHVDVTGPIESPIRGMSGEQEIIANR